MQINPLAATLSATPAVAAAVQTLRVTSGDVTQIQTGITVAVSVLRAGNGEAVVNLAGKPVTVRGAVALSPGDVLNVRVNGGATPTLDLVGQQPRAAATATAPPPPGSAEPRVAVADVIDHQPDGKVQVALDGEPTVATPQQPLQPGNRYVVRVESTPAGVVLKPLPESPDLPQTVATAILRTDRPPPLADTLPPLLREMNTVPPQPKAQAAAAEVKAAVRAVTAEPGQPPTADNLKALVADGGQQFEAKLGRAVETLADEPKPGAPAPPAPPRPAPDLKGGLLKLMAAVPELVAALPAAVATVDGIERQQAANVLAQQNGGAYVFQVPFPDGVQWRTVSLGVEPDRDGPHDEAGRPTAFRVMMHVPLTHLGDTWIDAGSDGSSLRAVLYVSDATARERVRPDLPGLRADLAAAGFADVLLDVKPAADLTDRQRRRANAVRAGVPESGGLLDVKG